jgi:hypothetical protein
MLESIVLYNLNYEKISFKKINNISFFILNYKQNLFKKTENIKKFKFFFAHSYIIYFLKII